jgi:hypothetical protein
VETHKNLKNLGTQFYPKNLGTHFGSKKRGGPIFTLNSIAKFFSTITKIFSKCTQISTVGLNLGHC